MTYIGVATFPVQPLEDIPSLHTVKGTRFHCTDQVLEIVKEAFYVLFGCGIANTESAYLQQADSGTTDVAADIVRLAEKYIQMMV